MLKFNVYFNYKNERRRGCVYLIIKTITIAAMLIISISTLDAEDLMAAPVAYVVCEICPYCLRLSVWIVILTTFIVFIRNLYDRFAALNCLLR